MSSRKLLKEIRSGVALKHRQQPTRVMENVVVVVKAGPIPKRNTKTRHISLLLRDIKNQNAVLCHRHKEPRVTHDPVVIAEKGKKSLKCKGVLRELKEKGSSVLVHRQQGTRVTYEPAVIERKQKNPMKQKKVLSELKQKGTSVLVHRITPTKVSYEPVSICKRDLLLFQVVRQRKQVRKMQTC